MSALRTRSEHHIQVQENRGPGEDTAELMQPPVHLSMQNRFEEAELDPEGHMAI